jgi:hypothetical protein
MIVEITKTGMRDEVEEFFRHIKSKSLVSYK